MNPHRTHVKIKAPSAPAGPNDSSRARRTTGGPAFRTWTRLAAAALMALGAVAGPAAANDLSTSPCTAGDVEIVGSGLVINEPCSCPPGGFFTATVQFTVRNNTSTGRYCVAIHLVADGVVSKDAVDVVLRDSKGNSTAPGKTGGERYHDTVMYGSIPNFPCNAGVVCFGEAGVTKGKCNPGACTTISWNTSNGASACTVADPNPPGGQCRHQQVCVVGYGASLSCVSGCAVTCGGSATLQACVTAPASRGPFTFYLSGDDGSVLPSQSSVGDTSGTACVSFTVSPTKAPATTYSLVVEDGTKEKCTRTDTATVSVTATTATITPPAAPGCNGVLSYQASVSGMTGCAFTWTVDGKSLADFLAASAGDDARLARVSGVNGCILDYRSLDKGCHAIEVTASCSAGGQTPCIAKASTTASQCVTATMGCTK